MEIIVMTGVQASGKSKFCKDHFSGYVIVNLDTLKTRKAENELIKECIENNISFVVDNTNVTVEQRKKYIDIAKENDYKVISYYLPVTKDISIDRNSQREGKAKVPNVAIYTALKRLVQPSKDEGFDEMHIIE